MSRGAFSGKGGSAKYTTMNISGGSSSGAGTPAEFFELTEWSFEPTIAIPKHNSNATDGVKDGVPGVRDSSGSITVKVHKTNGAPFGPGQTVQLLLDAGTGSIPKSLGVNYITVVGIIENAPTTVTLDGDGESLQVQYNFQGIRPWTGYGVFANYWQTI